MVAFFDLFFDDLLHPKEGHRPEVVVVHADIVLAREEHQKPDKVLALV